ncbi:PREDICTED: protein Brevis radix-like 1 [Erythranthe guttata]|uniref:protein Brevis radix-like 1 n=1 Tax=Erythranthe guttata TaxID=4155 RepID=UPI00064DCBF3|nr:PREDICTED: protein Brevis radix-like 1 [Erythranthe guttata]|eukprot:XP_012827327.1 PREDICTED: protein Brevis radix-like 1 [Erythranthe guttata]
MLTCIARSKQGGGDESPSIDHNHHHHHHHSVEKISNSDGGVPTKQAVRTLTSQIKDMALKASGAYRHCAPCANQPAAQPRRNGSSNSGSLQEDCGGL